jgi:hypothetical protein
MRLIPDFSIPGNDELGHEYLITYMWSFWLAWSTFIVYLPTVLFYWIAVIAQPSSPLFTVKEALIVQMTMTLIFYALVFLSYHRAQIITPNRRKLCRYNPASSERVSVNAELFFAHGSCIIAVMGLLFFYMNPDAIIWTNGIALPISSTIFLLCMVKECRFQWNFAKRKHKERVRELLEESEYVPDIQVDNHGTMSENRFEAGMEEPFSSSEVMQRRSVPTSSTGNDE